MNRKTFLKTLLLSGSGIFIGSKLYALIKQSQTMENTVKMPVLFLGHGSPMNAIEENEFVRGFRNIAQGIQTPTAIVVVSAHWETRGTQVTAMKNPPTIHDFGGFPKELFDVQYQAPGNPELASEIKNMTKNTDIALDEKWGLDHGAWSVIKHMYPEANIPVIQLSLDYYKKPQQHYELAKELNSLRNKGVLIVGSGNMVHNLRLVNWQKLDENVGYDWAIEADNTMKQLILDGNHQALINYSKLGRAFEMAIPTPEHYLPLLYVLALQENKDNVHLFNDKPVAGSLTMTSLKIG